MIADAQYEDPAERDKREDNELLAQISARLEEHFDSVRIIATKNRGTSTALRTRGGGDWYAQVGAVRAWLVEQDEVLKIELRRNE